MADPQRAKPLAVLEAKVRHALLMVGLGFFAFAGGSVISGLLAGQLQDHLAGVSAWVLFPFGVLLQQLWVLAVLPGLAYLCARFLPLKPWPTALTGAITGELFFLALTMATVGLDGVLEDLLRFAVLLATVVAGTVLTARAVRNARGWAAQQDERAKVAAEAKKHEYAEFLKASEALAEKRDAASPPTTPERRS